MNVDYNLGNRKWVIIGIMTVVVLIYLVRLFTLQVLDNDYKRFADSNAFLKKIQYPSRGLIYFNFNTITPTGIRCYDDCSGDSGI